jgi:hypothetical protein
LVVSPLRPRGRRRRPRESRVGLGGTQSGSGPLGVGGGAPEGPGDRGEEWLRIRELNM